MQFNFIFCPQTRKKKREKRKKTDLSRARCPIPSAGPGAAPPSTTGKHGHSLCHCIYEHTKFFYVISTIQVLACNKIGTLDARLENQSATQALRARGWGWAGAGTEALVGIGGMWCRKVSWNHLFPASLLVHLLFPFNHFTLMGSKTVFCSNINFKPYFNKGVAFYLYKCLWFFF